MSELDELVAGLRAALKAADKGPWFLLQGDDTACHNCGQEHVYYRWAHEYGEAGSILSTWPVEVMGCTDWNIANAHLIANAPTWLTAILDAYEAERARNETLTRRFNLSMEMLDPGRFGPADKQLTEALEQLAAERDKVREYAEAVGEWVTDWPPAQPPWPKEARLRELAATPPDGVSARREVERLKGRLQMYRDGANRAAKIHGKDGFLPSEWPEEVRGLVNSLRYLSWEPLTPAQIKRGQEIAASAQWEHTEPAQ